MMATEQSSWRYFLCALLIGSGALEQQAMSAQAAAKESGVAATTYAQSRVALAQILPVNDEVLSSAARYRVGINAAQNHSPAAPAPMITRGSRASNSVTKASSLLAAADIAAVH